VYVFELSLDVILNGNLPTFNALSKFPQVRRDIAVIVDQSVEAQQVVNLVREHGGENQQSCTVFDVYQGQGIEDGKKSLAVATSFQHPERSLNDEEIQDIMDSIITVLIDKLSASLRG
jgi:phenylalanyl-tRNA synthetase beta chain